MNHVTLLVRNDQGGLANQTHELYKRLTPDQTIVIEVDPSRGARRDDWYPGALRIKHTALNARMLKALTPPGGVIVTCETFYCNVSALEGRNRRVVVANAELFNAGEIHADVVIAPTSWELHRMPAGTRVISPSQPRPPKEYQRIRNEARTFLHLGAPAMLDRNGTGVFLEALTLMNEPCTAIVRSPEPQTVDINTGPTVIWDYMPVKEWYENYPVEADAIVIPRRYGGLCLPAQEAASCGLPVVMPNLSPQTDWPGPRFSEGFLPSRARMKGGMFDVYDPSASALAGVMDSMVRGDIDMTNESLDAFDWADSLLWNNVEPDWYEVLHA